MFLMTGMKIGYAHDCVPRASKASHLKADAVPPAMSALSAARRTPFSAAIHKLEPRSALRQQQARAARESTTT